MDRDCGFTKADILDPDGKTTFFCHHFARGCCNLGAGGVDGGACDMAGIAGAECSFLHRIPTELDVPRIDNLKDCFGRDRHRQHRDDMGGVGLRGCACGSGDHAAQARLTRTASRCMWADSACLRTLRSCCGTNLASGARPRCAGSVSCRYSRAAAH